MTKALVPRSRVSTKVSRTDLERRWGGRPPRRPQPPTSDSGARRPINGLTGYDEPAHAAQLTAVNTDVKFPKITDVNTDRKRWTYAAGCCRASWTSRLREQEKQKRFRHSFHFDPSFHLLLDHLLRP